jgi:hypothetical protein
MSVPVNTILLNSETVIVKYLLTWQGAQNLVVLVPLATSVTNKDGCTTAEALFGAKTSTRGNTSNKLNNSGLYFIYFSLLLSLFGILLNHFLNI